MSSISSEDQVAIVTGGGRGLGAEYARELAPRGAAVIVHGMLDAYSGQSRMSNVPVRVAPLD